MSEKKRALVLGCGGVAGAAWSIATLAELEAALDWDARQASILIGTSAGAILAALLGSGVSVSRMVKSQRGELADDCWNHDVDSGPSRPPRPGPVPTAPKLLLGALRRTVQPTTALMGLLPRGGVSTEPIGRLIDNVVPNGGWAPHAATWISTVDATTGRRVPFGRAGQPPAPLREAVRASYAVPGWCEPITIEGRTYLDGGIASPTSADLLIDTDVEEAIVLAPMASRAWDLPPDWKESRIEKGLREHMTRIVNREVRALEQAGIRVMRLEPSADDIVAFGHNMMSVRRRRHVFDTAVATARNAVADAMLGFRDDPAPVNKHVDARAIVARAS